MKFSQKYCKKQALEKKDNKLSLETNYANLEKRIDVNVNNEEVENSYTDVQREIREDI